MRAPDLWRDERRRLNAARHRLAVEAAGRYPAHARVGPTPLLCDPAWLPAGPVPLSAVRLRWNPAPPPAAPPAGPAGLPYGSYAEALAALDPPRTLENRPCYRLLSVAGGCAELEFGPARYFDGLNLGEAVAHEFAAGRDGLREAAGDPLDLKRRAALPALSVLTLRHDRAAGTAGFVLHWRDPALVAHGGGLYQVMPVGVFQPLAEDDPGDLDLWRCAVREYAEEFLGAAEDYGDGPFDYAGWPFFTAMTAARDAGRIRPYVLGLGVDPLSFATDLLVACVIDADVYDELLGALVESNEEGRVAARDLPLNAETARRFTRQEPMQAAGAAAIHLAWRHRRALLPEVPTTSP